MNNRIMIELNNNNKSMKSVKFYLKNRILFSLIIYILLNNIFIENSRAI